MIRQLFEYIAEDMRNAQPLETKDKIFVAAIGAAVAAQIAMAGVALYAAHECSKTGQPDSAACESHAEVLRSLDEPKLLFFF